MVRVLTRALPPAAAILLSFCCLSVVAHGAAQARRAHAAPVKPMAGSGFFVGPNRILTAEHNVHGCRRINIASTVAGQIDATIDRADHGDDFALLAVDVPQPPIIPILPMAQQTPPLGSLLPVMQVIGFAGENPANAPEMAEATPLNDQVREGHPAEPGSVLWLQSNAVVLGWSGGPVIDPNGNLAGMIVAISNNHKDNDRVMNQAPDRLALAIGAQAVGQFLEKVGESDVADGSVVGNPADAVVRVFCWR